MVRIDARGTESLFRMIDRNVRLPGRVLGDIRSQLAACEIAARGMTDLVERYGADGVVSLMNATMVDSIPNSQAPPSMISPTAMAAPVVARAT